LGIGIIGITSQHSSLLYDNPPSTLDQKFGTCRVSEVVPWAKQKRFRMHDEFLTALDNKVWTSLYTHQYGSIIRMEENINYTHDICTTS
jgi:hypothetical protein